MRWTYGQTEPSFDERWTTALAFNSLAQTAGIGLGSRSAAVQNSSGLLGVDDPVPGDTSTAFTLTVGAAPTVGTLELLGDQDYYKVELAAGQKYEIGMYAKYGGPNGIPLLDALFEIRNASGALIDTVDSGGKSTHNSASSGFDALTTFVAPYSGTYYVNARSFDDDVTGDGTGNYVGDYEVWVKTTLGEVAPVQPPSQSLFPTTTDTVGNDLSTTATIRANGADAVSTIDAPNDNDFYKIDMVAGNVYRITQSAETGGPTGVPVADAYFEIYDPTGHLVATATSGGPMPGGLVTTTVNAQIDFTATTTGTYYINARYANLVNLDGSGGEGMGDYRLHVEGWKPYYSPDSPLYAIDWGAEIDRTSRNPDGAEGPRFSYNPYEAAGDASAGIQGKNVIYYYFAKQGEVFVSQDPTNDVLTNSVASGFADWEKKAFTDALHQYEKVADLVYLETSDKNAADFVFITYNGTPQVGVLGRMSPPDTANEGQGEFNRQGPGWTATELQRGGFSFITLIHEMGHAHGLAHPHDNGGHSGVMQGVVADGTALSYSTGYLDLNQGVYTMMSYNFGWEKSPYGQADENAGYGYLGGLMAFDIAAIQDKYGVNEEYETGDNIYVLKDVNAPGTFYEAIWDAGGMDLISYAGGRDAVIDLRPASLKYENGGGGWISYAFGVYGGFTIANGVTIENANGGSGNDKLTGNDVENHLWGNAGNDAIDGGAGNDLLVGGAGKDMLTGGAGNDTFGYMLASESAVGAGRDVITDFAEGDRIDLTPAGGKTFIGDQLFSGGAGQVRAVTLTGQTIVELDSNGDRIADLQIELSGEFRLDRLDFVGLGGAPTAGNDEIFGTAAADTIASLDGNDTVYGMGGNDTLNGGAGDDVLVGGLGRDMLTGGTGADIFRFESFADSTASARDRILDFQSDIDQIDLSALGSGWRFIGSSAFSGGGGEVRFTKGFTSTFIEADFNGDMVPDLQIEVAGSVNLVSSDFIF
jgi:serralysin